MGPRLHAGERWKAKGVSSVRSLGQAAGRQRPGPSPPDPPKHARQRELPGDPGSLEEQGNYTRRGCSQRRQWVAKVARTHLAPRAKRVGLAGRKPQGAGAPGGGRKANGCAAVSHGRLTRASARFGGRAGGLARARVSGSTRRPKASWVARTHAFTGLRGDGPARAGQSEAEVKSLRGGSVPVGWSRWGVPARRQRTSEIGQRWQRLLQSRQRDAGGSASATTRRGNPARRRKRSHGKTRGFSVDGMHQVGLIEAGGRRIAPSTVPAPKSANSLGPNRTAPLHGDDA